MTGCEGFEVEIEMREHGALEASRVAALEAHLAGCPGCRRYQALARRTEQTMTAQALDVNGLHARIFALQDYRRARSWVALGVPVVLGLVLAALSGHPEILLPATAAVGLATFGVLRLRLALEARSLSRLGDRRDEVLVHYRRLLDGRIRRIHVGLVLVPLMGFVTLSEAELWHLWPASMRAPAVFAVIGVALLAAFLTLLVLRVRVVPALRRERRDLGGA